MPTRTNGHSMISIHSIQMTGPSADQRDLERTQEGILAERILSENIILLVEDNTGDVALLKCAFERAGLQHDFLVARNGQGTIEYLSASASTASMPAPTRVLRPIKHTARTEVRAALLAMRCPHGGSASGYAPLHFLQSHVSEPASHK